MMDAPADSETDTPAEVCVLAPWLIFTVTIECGPENKDQIYMHAGGQGFWVARMIRNLGGHPILCAPLGGESGVVVKALAEAEGIELRQVEAREWNGGYVHDRREGNRQPIASMRSAQLNRHETDNLYDATLAAGMKAGVAVLTGPLEEGTVPNDFQSRLAEDLDRNGVTVIADLSGSALSLLKGGVTFLKVSHEELIDAGHCQTTDRSNVLQGLRSLQKASKARNIIVSRADKPALALIENRLVEVEPPHFKPLDHHGAGDSMTAALAVAQARSLSLEDTLKWAAGAGALNVTRRGLGTGELRDIGDIAANVVVREISES